MTQTNLCFRCMHPLNSREETCQLCGHDNHIRHNGPGMLEETLLNGQYLVGKLLGRGGFGVTYIGYDINLKRRIAIKEYYPGNLVARESGKHTLSAVTGCEEDYLRGLQRALRESQVAANLGQIYGVVQVYNVFTANNTVYIIMEYVEGQTFSKLVEESQRRLTVQETMELLSPVARALETLHQRRVIHRDVKPDNIMIRKESRQGVLLDFGAARVLDNNTISSSSTVVSQGYAPPEQYNLSSLDGRIDQYALAATVYFALSGVRPADVIQRLAQPNCLPTIRSKNPGVSQAVENVVHKGMALKSQDRYPSVEAFWNALQNAAGKGGKQTISLKKAVAICLSVAIAGGALGYFVPRMDIWQPKPKGQPVVITTVTEEPVITEKPVVTDEPAITDEPTVTDAPVMTDDPTVTDGPTNTPPVTDQPTEAPTETPIVTDEPTPTPTEAPTPTPEPTPAPEFAYEQQEDGSLVITGYLGSETDVVIPAELDGLPVTAIGPNAFEGLIELTSITLPEGIRSIGAWAFGDLNLTSITLPEGLEIIDNDAFHWCDKLTSITLPDSVRTIGERAFYDCSALTDITIPAGVTELPHLVFGNCPSLTDVTLHKDVNWIANTAFDDSPVTLKVQPGMYGELFANSKGLPYELEERVSNPASDFTYEQREDYICITGYTGSSGSVAIPEEIDGLPVGQISDGAFCQSGMQYVTLPHSLHTLGAKAFMDCDALVRVGMPGGVEVIREFTFLNCSSLSEVDLPDSLTAIEDCAFLNCTRLGGLTLPASVTSISENAFANCPSLVLLVDPASYGDTYASHYGIPMDFKPEYYANETDLLYEVLDDDSVCILQYTGSNEVLKIPDYIDDKPVTSIGPGAFAGNQSIQLVILPFGTTSLHSEAFRGCSNLTYITLHENLTTIGDNAFTDCVNLGAIAFPAWITDIADSAFTGCPSLVLDVDLMSAGWRHARTHGIPYTCPAIESAAAEEFIYQVDEDGIIHITKYIGDREFVVIPDTLDDMDVGYIGTDAFANKAQLRMVSIPSTVNVIDSSAFAGCTGLEVVELAADEDYCVSIGANAFDGCSALWDINLSDCVDYLGSAAFRGCASLSSLSVPSNISVLYDNVFAGCTGLTQVVVPESVNIIMNSAFTGCPNLTLYVKEGSKALKYAESYGIPHQLY